MNRRLAIPLLTVAAAALSACGDAAPAATAAEPVVRDSAGITIVENDAPLWAEGDGWRLSSRPPVEIGMIDGPEEYQLFRVWAARRLEDGRIVVVDGGSNQLRFFSADGTFLLAVGGTGGGPTEFSSLMNVWVLPGDSILAYDFAPPRLSVWTSTGEFARSFAVPSPDGRQVFVRGPLGDGSLVVEGAPIWDAEGVREGLVRDSVPFYRFDAEGNLLATTGMFPSGEVFRAITDEGVRLTSPPFPRQPAKAVAGGTFYFAAADRYEIDVRPGAGEIERRIRLSHRGDPVTSAHVQAFRAERERTPDGGPPSPVIQRLLSDLPVPETMPAHGYAMIVDESGNIWLSDYRPLPDYPAGWRVFTSDGRYLGPFDFPEGVTPLHIGEDFVLAHRLDELEVEHVHFYDLIKPEAR
jgi:hypothetical protein